MARSRMHSSIDCRPLFATPRTPTRRTLGPRVGQIAAILGKPLMPWQVDLADVALEVVPADNPRGWRLAYDSVTLVVMRQQGKTELTFPLMTHRATGFGEAQQIRYTAQTAFDARKKWEDIHVARLRESPLRGLFRTRMQQSRELMVWSNGSMWGPVSPTGKSTGTGDSLDMAVIDEAWSRPDSKAELGFRPAMLTRENRQLWRVSMVPGPTRSRLADPKRKSAFDSAYLRGAMRKGRAAVRNGVTHGTCYVEFGAPKGSDPADPATWWGCMPALGHTIGEEAVQSDFDDFALDDFCAEYLSWWAQDEIPSWTTIKKPTWSALHDPFSSAAGSVAVAAECTDDRTLGYLGICGRRADGDLHLEVVEPGHDVPLGTAGVEWMFKRLMEFIKKWDPLAVVIDPKGPANFLIPLLRREKVDVITPNIPAIEGSCGRLYDATGQEVQEWSPESGEEPPVRIRHIGQSELDKAVAGARKLTSPTTGTFRWARVASVANIAPLYAVNLAMHGYELKMNDDYDVMDSVG